jgi:hypothetical protein
MRRGPLLLLTLLGLACREPRRAALVPAPPAGAGQALPDIAGFSAGAVETNASFVRRTYTRNQERTNVTVARFPMTDLQYRDWLRMSTADYPQAVLPVPTTEGNGFYQCAPGDPSRCNLLVQLRCGLHIEIRGDGIARKADADAIALGLTLAEQVKSCRGG